MVYVGDSIASHLAFPKVEAASGTLIRPFKAYGAEEDTAAWKPKLNVRAVVEKHLKGGATGRPMQCHTLVLGAPTVDVTNQSTAGGVKDDNTVRTVASSHSMVETAELALRSGQVEQVVREADPTSQKGTGTGGKSKGKDKGGKSLVKGCKSWGRQRGRCCLDSREQRGIL